MSSHLRPLTRQLFERACSSETQMKRFAGSNPPTVNMMLMGWTSPSPLRPSSYGTPAAAATMPLPVASITTLDLNVRSPSTNCTRTPTTRLPSITGASTCA